MISILELSFSFQPNPSDGTVNVNVDFELQKVQPWEIQLTNSLDKTIRSYAGKTSGLKDNTLHFPSLLVGIYYLTLFADDTSKRRN